MKVQVLSWAPLLEKSFKIKTNLSDLKMKKFIPFILFFIFPFLSWAMPEIKTVNGTERELKTKERLESLFFTYDLNKYEFTKRVNIEQFVVSHSHPILTLNTRYKDESLRLLVTYVHEQLHWFLEKPENEMHLKSFILEVKNKYSELPIGEREGGARSEYSSYLHMAVCTLELKALQALLGEEKALALFSTDPIYFQLKKIILNDYEFFNRLLNVLQLTVD